MGQSRRAALIECALLTAVLAGCTAAPQTQSPDASAVVVESLAAPLPPGTPTRDPGDLYALFETSMNRAERCTPERVARLIAEGADPNYLVTSYVGDPGNTPLRLALIHGVSAETIRVLLESGADPHSAEFLVIAAPDLERMQLLLDAGTPVNGPLRSTDPKGWTALMLIVHRGIPTSDLEALRFMIAAGADAAHKAPDGKTAYSIALEKLKQQEDYNASQYPDGNMPDWAVKGLATQRAIAELLKTASDGRPLSSSSGASQRLAVPFVDRDVCPWEGCNFGRWIADKPITAYAVEGEPTRVAFEIAQDEGYVAETGNMWIHRPGIVQVIKAVTLPNPEGRSVPPLVLSPGDTLAVLTSLGEGRYHVWHGGSVYLVQMCWGPASDEPHPGWCGILVDKGDREWWVRVRNSTGKIGWTRSAR